MLLNENVYRRLATIGVQLEHEFDAPQDVEYVVTNDANDDSHIFIVQVIFAE